MTDAPPYGSANARRAAAAAARDVAMCQAVADDDRGQWPESWTAIARARVDHPSDTLAELAARLGVTKNQAAARLRRVRTAMEER